MRRRTLSSTVVITTIALAVAMLVAFPGVAHEIEADPMAPVVFTGAWTNDDGGVNGGDIGDTGLPSLGFDFWPVNDSSDDPETPGTAATRRPDDAARCVAGVRDESPTNVDLAIDLGTGAYTSISISSGTGLCHLSRAGRRSCLGTSEPVGEARAVPPVVSVA